MFIELVYKNGTVIKEYVLWVTVNVKENIISYVLNENPHPIGNIITVHLDNIDSVNIEMDGAN